MKLTLKDFDLLTESQMEFKYQDWHLQAVRFAEVPNFELEFIYWLENAAAMVLATKYLEQEGFEYETNYDLRLDQPIIITNYAGSWISA